MSTETSQIQIYVNLEPHAVRDTAVLNFQTYFNHLLRAMEIPMIQFLEQIYNEASIRAKSNSSTTPMEFQVILREFVRQPSEDRQKIFIEHLQHGKHSFDHLGTIATLALRELTQSLTSRDFELVALAQSQSDAPRFQVQTGITHQTLFLDAIIEAARLMDRNPTYFSRSVGAVKMLENRAIIRSEIESALRTALEDNAIKGYLSLRQHISDVAMQGNTAKLALQDHRQKQKRSDFRSSSRQMMPNSTHTWKSAVDVNDLSDTPSLPSPKKPTPTALPPPVLPPSKQQIIDLDQRASPLSSNEAKQAQEEFQQMLQQSKVKSERPQALPAPASTIMQTKSAKSVQTNSVQPAPQEKPKANLQEGRFRLEEPTVAKSEQITTQQPAISNQLPRANSDNALRKDNQVALESGEFLSGDEEEEFEEEE